MAKKQKKPVDKIRFLKNLDLSTHGPVSVGTIMSKDDLGEEAYFALIESKDVQRVGYCTGYDDGVPVYEKVPEDFDPDMVCDPDEALIDIALLDKIYDLFGEYGAQSVMIAVGRAARGDGDEGHGGGFNAGQIICNAAMIEW